MSRTAQPADDTPNRFLELPAGGTLLVCTDIHGNWNDFDRMRSIFLSRLKTESCYLLFSGDLIHGPNVDRASWPDYMGSFFEDRSVDVLEGFFSLQRDFPDRVFSLLGNHEHSHVGGPRTPKFWPDEAAHLEKLLGPERTTRMKHELARWPILAVTCCGVLVTHAAPNADVSNLSELRHVSYSGYEKLPAGYDPRSGALMRLLWSRRCSPNVAQQFLSAFSQYYDRPFSAVVFGHDVVHEGYRRVGAGQLQLSTSFGLQDPHKAYLELNLAARYRSTEDFVEGQQLKRLYDSVS